MEEISSSGSGEGPGQGNRSAYSTSPLFPHTALASARRAACCVPIDDAWRRRRAGLAALAEGLTIVDATDERWWDAETPRLKGELLLRQAIPDRRQAETCLHQALDVARSQQAKSLELRTATSLARLWRRQDKRQDAYDLLAPVYRWFSERVEAGDLKEAKTLLQELV